MRLIFQPAVPIPSIVRNNTALSAHKLICQARCRLLKKYLAQT